MGSIKDCPFCGDNNVTYCHSKLVGFHQCNTCGANGPIVKTPDLMNSREMWNMRETLLMSEKTFKQPKRRI